MGVDLARKTMNANQPAPHADRRQRELTCRARCRNPGPRQSFALVGGARAAAMGTRMDARELDELPLSPAVTPAA
jgi:hypothetical protein